MSAEEKFEIELSNSEGHEDFVGQSPMVVIDDSTEKKLQVEPASKTVLIITLMFALTPNILTIISSALFIQAATDLPVCCNSTATTKFFIYAITGVLIFFCFVSILYLFYYFLQPGGPTNLKTEIVLQLLVGFKGTLAFVVVLLTYLGSVASTQSVIGACITLFTGLYGMADWPLRKYKKLVSDLSFVLIIWMYRLIIAFVFVTRLLEVIFAILILTVLQNKSFYYGPYNNQWFPNTAGFTQLKTAFVNDTSSVDFYCPTSLSSSYYSVSTSSYGSEYSYCPDSATLKVYPKASACCILHRT